MRLSPEEKYMLKRLDPEVRYTIHGLVLWTLAIGAAIVIWILANA